MNMNMNMNMNSECTINPPKAIGNVLDKGVDALDKISTPSSRSGSTVQRVSRLAESGVAPEAIALQLSTNSHNQQAYSKEDVQAYSKLYLDSKTKVGITAEQTRGLIRDQEE